MYLEPHILPDVMLIVHAAHKDAYEVAKILHRDLSVKNIIIFRGKGILIDWDLAKVLTIQGPRQVTRTVCSFYAQTHCTDFAVAKGTWQFMSAHLVKNIKAIHAVEDDLKSSLYVVLWTALMYK
jgi:tRNA A-37 threonylcarbamoyl transferase component Bud32